MSSLRFCFRRWLGRIANCIIFQNIFCQQTNCLKFPLVQSHSPESNTLEPKFGYLEQKKNPRQRPFFVRLIIFRISRNQSKIAKSNSCKSSRFLAGCLRISRNQSTKLGRCSYFCDKNVTRIARKTNKNVTFSCSCSELLTRVPSLAPLA